MTLELETINIELPEINGRYEVGIAAQSDLSLPDRAKLRVNCTLASSVAATQAAVWASNDGAQAVG